MLLHLKLAYCLIMCDCVCGVEGGGGGVVVCLIWLIDCGL